MYGMISSYVGIVGMGAALFFVGANTVLCANGLGAKVVGFFVAAMALYGVAAASSAMTIAL